MQVAPAEAAEEAAAAAASAAAFLQSSNRGLKMHVDFSQLNLQIGNEKI